MSRAPVIQQDPTGCAIASVANITGKSYAEVRDTAASLGIYASDPKLWSETSYIRQLLSHYGVRSSAAEHPFVSWDALPDRALLAIKWHLEHGKPFWHWVVFVRTAQGAYVLDSKRGLRHNRRTDFGRIRPNWFIAVTDAIKSQH